MDGGGDEVGGMMAFDYRLSGLGAGFLLRRKWKAALILRVLLLFLL